MNTEQFDGHTPGPWVLDNDEVKPLRVILNEDTPDARLIAAAPDLLAEVKRLRRLNDYLWEHRSSHWSADDDAEMDRLEMME